MGRKPRSGAAERLSLRHHSTVELIDRMEARGTCGGHETGKTGGKCWCRCNRAERNCWSKCGAAHHRAAIEWPALVEAIDALLERKQAGGSGEGRRNHPGTIEGQDLSGSLEHVWMFERQRLAQGLEAAAPPPPKPPPEKRHRLRSRSLPNCAVRRPWRYRRAKTSNSSY